MAEPIRVWIGSREDADCIYEAVSHFRLDMIQRGNGWIVDIYPASDRDRAIAEVLSAVERCLDEHRIGEVRIDLDGRSYTMRSFTLAAATP